MRDTFALMKESLLTTTAPIDLTQETSVTGFEIGGVEPATSQRRILFQVDGRIYRFEGNNLMQVDCDKTVSDVLEKGNSVAELLAVTDISSWCGKLIYPIIALRSDASAGVMPSIKLAIKSRSFSDIFQKSQLSKVFNFDCLTTITAINFTKSVTGGGNAVLQVRLLQGDEWSNFLSVDDALNQSCRAIQLKALETVTSTTGSSSAQITSVEIETCRTGEVTSAVGAIYFKPEDFSEDLATCYVLIKHKFLANNDLKVFVSFADLPTEKDAVIGVGTGSPQSFQLDSGIDLDSFIVTVDGVRTLDFTFNATSNNLTLTADSGKNIAVSYKYNLTAENWLECEKQFTQLDQNDYSGSGEEIFASRFVYRLETPERSKVVKVKIQNTAQDTDFEICKIGVGFTL